MPIPSGFYYSETISTEQYSSNPQGMPNFIRMAQLKSDYWPKNFPASVPKPKTLIFADWTARAWDQDKINAVVKKFAELTKAGFKLYLWQKGAIKLLSDPMVLKDYDVRVNTCKHI